MPVNELGKSLLGNIPMVQRITPPIIYWLQRGKLLLPQKDRTLTTLTSWPNLASLVMSHFDLKPPAEVKYEAHGFTDRVFPPKMFNLDQIKLSLKT